MGVGVGLGLEDSKILQILQRRLNQTRADVAKVHGAEHLASLGCDVFIGKAKFASNRKLMVEIESMPSQVHSSDNGEKTQPITLNFCRGIIATGSSWRLPSIGGLRKIDYLSSEKLGNLKSIPTTLAVFGASREGLETAQV